MNDDIEYLDDFKYNDLDDDLQVMYDNEKLYSYYEYADYGVGISFEILDMWDAFRAPSLLLSFDHFQNNYRVIIFYSEINYKYIKKIEIEINDKKIITLEDSKYTLSDFCLIDDLGKFLNGSEIQFMKTIGKFLNLKAFI
jgi:hypothetical protein